jgi:hypothetical protein
MHRHFVDSFGFFWQVWEIDNAVAAGRVGPHHDPEGPWLYFFSRGTTRRTRAYPKEWDSSSWVVLEDLCGQAEVLGAERLTGLVRTAEPRRQAAAVQGSGVGVAGRR